MRDAVTVLEIIRERGKRGLPLERVYRCLFNRDLYLLAYGKIYRNAGAMTPGVTSETVDGMDLGKIEAIIGALRQERYRWTPVRRTYIEKKGSSKKRPLGLPTWSDKLLQEVLRLILEAYYEPQFSDRSHGFRPGRGCHTALLEVYHQWRGTVWFIEGDITDCFDEISHPALMERVRKRVGDKRVLALVKAFLKAGILLEDGTLSDTDAGTPQGSILSPLLSNVALSVLDEHIAHGPGGPAATPYERAKRRRQGLPNYRLVRYADDWCLLVHGTKVHAEALRDEIAGVLSTMGLRLSPEKTLVTHIDEGLVFLGWRIQRHRKRGTGKSYVYIYPAKKSLAAVMAKVQTICRVNTNLPLEALLHPLNRMLRGWTTYFKYGCSHATFSYLRSYLWKQVVRWQERKHRRTPWKELRRRYGIWPATSDVVLFDPARVRATRYYYRGTRIPTPWPSTA
jgi:RNA-directed DNA polymerase